MKIERHKDTGPFRLEATKRFHLPYDVTAECPSCKAENKQSLDDHYILYPTIGEPNELHFCCEKCEHEWLERVVIGITLTKTGIKDGDKTVWFPATRPPDSDREVQVYISDCNLKPDPHRAVRSRQAVSRFHNGDWTEKFVIMWSELRSDPGFCVTECPRCKGTGMTTSGMAGFPCEVCDGTGKVHTGRATIDG